jgi:hypothetical protein
MRFRNGAPALVIVAALAVGCSGQATTPHGMGRVVFQLATTEAGSANGPAAADVVISKGTNVVVINQVQLVARKIRFRQETGSCAEDLDQDDAPAASESDESHDLDDADCPTLKLGPLLLDPPLTDGAETSFAAEVPVGTYTGIKLQIHRPRGSRDQAFLAAHPEFDGVSIRVKGTFNGAPFTFDTGIEEEEEIHLASPVVVTDAGTTAFTLFLDVRGWFLDQSGAALVDPTAPSSGIRSLIEHNIRSSFRAFEDADHDGHEDDDHDGH